MRKILLVLLLFVSGYAVAQSNYIPYQSRNRWIAGKFDSTLHIPKGVTPGLYTGGSTQSGALFYRTSDSSLYVYTGYQWRKLGEGGSTDSTLFATVYRTDTLAQNIRDEIAALPAPTTPTLQDVFATESNNALMTGNFKVDVNGHDIDFDDAVNGFITVSSYFSMVGGDSLNMQSSDANRILLKNDTVFIKPVLGNLNIDSLNSGSSADSVLVWDKETGSVKYRNAADFGGGGGGGVTDIGTVNGVSGSTDGAVISGTTLYMQTYTAENPGLVPAGFDYIDSVYRVTGKDSIFARYKEGVVLAIKDSTGGSGSLDKGTTTIASSATRRILYDSSGVLSNNANFIYNSSGELIVGGTTDNGSYVFQSNGNAYFSNNIYTGGSILEMGNSSRVNFGGAGSNPSILANSTSIFAAKRDNSDYVDFTAKSITATNTITTGNPGSGAGAWKLGTAVTTSGLTLNTTTYVEVSIGGTVYRLAVVDPPQP